MRFKVIRIDICTCGTSRTAKRSQSVGRYCGTLSSVRFKFWRDTQNFSCPFSVIRVFPEIYFFLDQLRGCSFPVHSFLFCVCLTNQTVWPDRMIDPISRFIWIFLLISVAPGQMQRDETNGLGRYSTHRKYQFYHSSRFQSENFGWRGKFHKPSVFHPMSPNPNNLAGVKTI
jgi:hypothetical protein